MLQLAPRQHHSASANVIIAPRAARMFVRAASASAHHRRATAHSSRDARRSPPSNYQYLSHRTVPIAKRFEWTPGSRSSEDAAWPPLGLGLEVTFAPPHVSAPLQPAACPENCTTDVCPANATCTSNPGGRWVHGPLRPTSSESPMQLPWHTLPLCAQSTRRLPMRLVAGPDAGELYPFYGKPCKQQSDCALCWGRENGRHIQRFGARRTASRPQLARFRFEKRSCGVLCCVVLGEFRRSMSVEARLPPQIPGPRPSARWRARACARACADRRRL